MPGELGSSSLPMPLAEIAAITGRQSPAAKAHFHLASVPAVPTAQARMPCSTDPQRQLCRAESALHLGFTSLGKCHMTICFTKLLAIVIAFSFPSPGAGMSG